MFPATRMGLLGLPYLEHMPCIGKDLMENIHRALDHSSIQ